MPPAATPAAVVELTGRAAVELAGGGVEVDVDEVLVDDVDGGAVVEVVVLVDGGGVVEVVVLVDGGAVVEVVVGDGVVGGVDGADVVGGRVGADGDRAVPDGERPPDGARAPGGAGDRVGCAPDGPVRDPPPPWPAAPDPAGGGGGCCQ